MPGLDWIPGVAQMKSLGQLVTGDVDGFVETNLNFLQECPVVSQVTSVVQLAAGDDEGALETQKKCLGTINNVANATPVVGHVKGLVHYAVGDEDGGDRAMLSATRTTAVVGTGIVVGVATGGVGAIPTMLAAGGGIGAGLTYDGVHSVVTDKPQGFVAAIENAVENPKFSTIFDAAAVPTFDALGGIGGGKMGGQIRAKVDASVTKGANVQKVNALEVARDAKLAQLDSLGDNGGTTGQALQLGQEINALTSQIHQLQTGSTQFWYDVKQNQVVTQQTPTSVPIAGQYASDSDREALKNAFYEQKSTKQLQLTAQELEFLLHDKYYDLQNTGKCYTRKQKEQSISSKHKASPSLTLTKAFTHTKLSNVQKQYYQNDQNPNLNKKEEKEMEDRAWLPVRMPNQFTYTGGILTNSPFQGLLHSAIRHGSEWSRFIGQGTPYSNSWFTNKANEIENESDIYKKGQLQKDFEVEYMILKFAQMFEFIAKQKSIYKFICKNVNYSQYLGEGANSNGKVQVYFRVKNRFGKDEIMVIALSDEPFIPQLEFDDPRKIRSIITVYFRDIGDLNNGIVISKEF